MKALKIADRMEECRSTAQILHGERYDQEVELYRRVVAHVADEQRCDYMDAALKILQNMEEAGKMTAGAIMMICAALCDMVEEHQASVAGEGAA